MPRSPGITALIFHRGPDIAEAIEYCNELTDPFEFCLHSYRLVCQYKSAENMLIQHCGLRISTTVLYDSRKVDPRMSHILKCFETKTFDKHNLLIYYGFLSLTGRGRSFVLLHHPNIDLPQYAVNSDNFKIVFLGSYEETKVTDEVKIQLTSLPGMLIRLRGNTNSKVYHDPFTVWACQAHLLLQDATRSSLDKLMTTIMLSASVVLEIRPHHDLQLPTHAERLDPDDRFLYLFSHPPTRMSWEEMDRGNYFWATDGKGEHRIRESLIQEIFGVSVRCDWSVDWCEFPSRFYSVLHDIHIACGFNPYSTEIAEYLGVPLYVREQDASGLQECSDSESSDCASSNCSNYASANGDMEELE
ncbi:hypothetical protein C8J56DRAFT_1025635 [Mycena floridula]|nr:hypothetical protein C8J56DRAFT_1025635 [Mycena floridula]